MSMDGRVGGMSGLGRVVERSDGHEGGREDERENERGRANRLWKRSFKRRHWECNIDIMIERCTKDFISRSLQATDKAASVHLDKILWIDILHLDCTCKTHDSVNLLTI